MLIIELFASSEFVLLRMFTHSAPRTLWRVRRAALAACLCWSIEAQRRAVARAALHALRR